MRNVEIKAEIKNEDLQNLLEVGQELSGTPGEVIHQHDTFFQTPQGRLKLRRLENSSELIYYDRPDQEGPKLSTYSIFRITGSGSDLAEVLTLAYGIKGDVKKRRTLFLIGQTRLHVDEVENLGTFMELEVVLTDDQSIEEGQRIADVIMGKIGEKFKVGELITCAYMDLINEKIH